MPRSPTASRLSNLASGMPRGDSSTLSLLTFMSGLRWAETGEFMETIPLGVSSLRSSRLAYGCWRVAGSWNPAEVTSISKAAGRKAIIAAFEAGYTLFDIADIYC